MNIYSVTLSLASSQCAYVADSAALSITGDLTGEAWIKMTQLPSVAGSTFTIFSTWRADNNQRQYRFFIDTSDNLRFQISDDGTGAGSDFKVTAAFVGGDVGVWKHVAVVLNVSTPDVVFYVDGVVVPGTIVASADTSIFDGTSDFVIGGRNSGAGAYTDFFDGVVDEVRVWNDRRFNWEILTYFKRELEGNDANLVGYWKLENDYNDSSPSANNLTAVGSPSFSTDVPFEHYPNYMAMMGVGR